MKKILLSLFVSTGISLAWGQSITRSLPSSLVPPPPPNQAAIQNTGSLGFYVFQQNMLAPLSQKKNTDSSNISGGGAFNVTGQAIQATKDPYSSLLPRSDDSSIRGLHFVAPSPLHPN